MHTEKKQRGKKNRDGHSAHFLSALISHMLAVSAALLGGDKNKLHVLLCFSEQGASVSQTNTQPKDSADHYLFSQLHTLTEAGGYK